MANSFWGGLLQGLGPAIQAQQESTLKQKMLDMQMQDYQARQQETQAQAAAHAQQRQLIEQWKVAPPEERKTIEREISLNQGKIPGQTVAEQMADFQKSGGMGMPGGSAGGGDNPYAQGMDMAPSFGPRGMTMTGSVRHPSGKQAEVQGLLYSVGADPNNRAALIDASSVINATPEAQYQLMQQFQSKYGGGQSAAPQGGGQQQAPQQKQQQEPGIEAVGPDGQPIMFDNQATMDEYKQRGLPLGPNGGAQQLRQQSASGGNPYDVIREKETVQKGIEAGITARQSEANKTLPEGTQKVIRDSENMRYQVGQLAKLWRPEFTGAGAQGPLQAVKKYTGIGLAPGEADYNAITANMRQAILRGDIGSAQTASELVNALDRIGEPGMTDEVYRSRLGVLDQLLAKANEDAIGLATTPMGGVGDYLKSRRQAAPDLEPGAARVPGRGQPKEQPQAQHAGVAVGGTVDSMRGLPDRAVVEDDQGRKFIIRNGKPMPYPGK